MENNNTSRKVKLGVWLVLAGIILGWFTLGAGYNAGGFLVRHFLQQPEVVVEVPNITTVHVNPLSAPIYPIDHDFAYIIPQIKPAVVSIYVSTTVINATGDARDSFGSGSGFIFRMDEDFAYIATNAHVVETAEQIFVSLDDLSTVPAVLVGSDRDNDLAVLAVSVDELRATEIPFSVASFGDSNLMRPGDSVIAIGNAMGEGQTVTMGIISATDITITVLDNFSQARIPLHVMQTDAAVNRGNSGGPLINQYGEVIGIITAKLIGNDIEGMGYALPANNVYDLLLELMTENPPGVSFVAVELQQITDFHARLFNLPSPGLLITAVTPDSAAYEAGLQIDDLIVSINGEETFNKDEFNAFMTVLRPGETAIIGLYRNNILLEVPVLMESVY